MFSGRMQRFQGILSPAVMLAVVVLYLILPAGYARACESEIHSRSPVNIAQSVKAASVATSYDLKASPVGFDYGREIGIVPCTKGSSHSAASGCQIGCCAGCTAAIGVALSGLELPEGLAPYNLSAEDGIISISAPRQFRPPRSTT
jgi:hypothetical protein